MAEYFYSFMDCQLWDQPLQRCTTFFYTFLIGTVPLLNYRYPFNRALSCLVLYCSVFIYSYFILFSSSSVMDPNLFGQEHQSWSLASQFGMWTDTSVASYFFHLQVLHTTLLK